MQKNTNQYVHLSGISATAAMLELRMQGTQCCYNDATCRKNGYDGLGYLATRTL